MNKVRATALGLTFLAACSSPETVLDKINGEASTAPAPADCQPLAGEPWMPVPDIVNVERVAQALSVDPERVRSGRLGATVCDNAMTTQDIVEGNNIFSVEGQGAECLAVAVADNGQPPKPQQTHNIVLAVCAGPEIVSNI